MERKTCVVFTFTVKSIPMIRRNNVALHVTYLPITHENFTVGIAATCISPTVGDAHEWRAISLCQVFGDITFPRAALGFAFTGQRSLIISASPAPTFRDLLLNPVMSEPKSYVMLGNVYVDIVVSIVLVSTPLYGL